MEVYVHTTVSILQKENKKFSSLGNKFTCSIKLFFIIVKNEYYLYYMFFVCALHQVIWCCIRAIAPYLFFFNILCYNQKYIHVPISKRHTVHNVIVCAVWKILKIISSTWWTIWRALYCIQMYVHTRTFSTDAKTLTLS